MRVLVTGGAGFIGSNVVKLLEEKGAEAIVLDDFSHADFRNLTGARAEVICAGILDKDVFKNLPPLDGVIHEAAITDTTLKDDTKMMTVNFNGFKNVFHFCQDKNIKLVYASSAGVYGGGASPMRESQPAQPLNTYAYSKYLCDSYAQKNINAKNSPLVVGLRYFNVYGYGEFHKGPAASMIYQLYWQMKTGRRPRVFKYGEQKRDFVYVGDVARITVAALELEKNVILNVGTGRARSFNDIIMTLNKALGEHLEPDYFDNPYGGVYQDYTEADIRRLEDLNLKAQFSLEEGIEDYIAGKVLKRC